MNNFLYLRIFIHPSIFNQHRRALWRVFLVIPCFFAFFIAAPSLAPTRPLLYLNKLLTLFAAFPLPLQQKTCV